MTDSLSEMTAYMNEHCEHVKFTIHTQTDEKRKCINLTEF